MLPDLPLEFDPDKDRRNRVKHGMSLSDAGRIEWDTAFVWPDTRFDYGEERMTALGYIGVCLYHVAFVDHPLTRRIISLRRATLIEEKLYARTQARPYQPDPRRRRTHHRRRIK